MILAEIIAIAVDRPTLRGMSNVTSDIQKYTESAKYSQLINTILVLKMLQFSCISRNLID